MPILRGVKHIIVILCGLVTLSKTASITSNIEDSPICPGKQLILTCSGMGSSQRWTIMKEGIHLAEKVYSSGEEVGTNATRDVFYFTLSMAYYNNFVSILSTLATNELDNVEVSCTDHGTPATASIFLLITDELSPPQNLSVISIERHSNDSTVVVTWEPASDDSYVDFYQYQITDNLTDSEVRVINTTNTTAVLSGVPYNVNISFVISAYNCGGESEQATLVINIELLNSFTDFDQVTSQMLSKRFEETTTDVAVITPPSGNKTDLLLISTTVASTVIIMVLLVVCAIVAVVFVKQLQRKRLDLTRDVELYTEIENGIPIYEAVDKMLNCSEPVNEADMSYVDMCGGVSLDPVYDSTEMKLEAANDSCKVDETLKSTECFNLSNNGTQYQNNQEEKYSHYSNLPQHQQPTGCSIYDD